MAEDHVNSPTEYQLMEEEMTSSTEKIYILTSSHLPSHIRSVEVKHSGMLTDLSTMYCSTRTVNIVLVLVFVFVTSLTVSIAAYKITEITDTSNRFQHIVVPDANSTDEPQQYLMTTEGENSTIYLDSNTTETNAYVIRHCTHECQLYLDPKFQSECAFGRCVCRGENYQFLTCLPAVGECAISKGFSPFANFSMDNITTSVYGCRPYTKSSGPNLYIVSLYGNHYANSTVVDIQGEISEPATLVLANYYPVTWTIRKHRVYIEKIILASKNNIASSEVKIVSTAPEPETDISVKEIPKVTAMQIPVGFGNDIHESKTVEMLKILTDRIGTVHVFVGTEYADYISLQIDTNSRESEQKIL